MERATELHWLKWFYQAADIGLTEEDRMELERQFVKEENLLIPKAYEIDDDPLTPVNCSKSLVLRKRTNESHNQRLFR